MRISLKALLLLLCVSCAKEQTTTYKNYLLVTDDVKTSIDVSSGSKGIVHWKVGDQVMFCFDNGTTTISPCLSDGKVGSFRVAIPANSKKVYAFHYGQEKDGLASWDSGEAGKVALKLPQTNDGEWLFDEVNALVGSADVDDQNVMMSPAFGLLELSTGRKDIDRIILSCVNGEFFHDSYIADLVNGSVKPASYSGLHSTVSYRCSGSDASFYIPIPEGNYSGFTITMENVLTGESEGVVNVPAIKMTRGKIVNLGNLKDRISTPLITFSEDNDISAVPAFGENREVSFNAVSEWTLSTIGNISVSNTSGPAGDNRITVTFPENTGAAAFSSLVFSSKSGFASSCGFFQQRRPDYSIIFRNYPDIYSRDKAYRTWTNVPGTLFDEPLASFGSYTLNQFNPDVSLNKIKIGLFSNVGNEGSLGYSEIGFMIGYSGANTGGYVLFPAIAGRRLAAVGLFTCAASTNQCVKCSIQNMEGTIVPGGEIWTPEINPLSCNASANIQSPAYELTNCSGSYHMWTLQNTSLETEYKLNFNSRLMVRWITLYYE